ncbi:MAG: hypothetical protein ABIB11_06210 [Candidatus Omnitrophota bacterium]
MEFVMNPFSPAPPIPGGTYEAITTLSTESTYNRKVTCEGVDGQYSEHCQQPPRMGPMPGPMPGFPAALRQLPCASYCTLPSGEQAVWDDRFNNWRPPLTSLTGVGSDIGMGFFWIIGLAALAYLVTK